jgi:uncharacterized protein (TIGR02996 family)
MASVQPGLLERIIAAPDDDAPRLVYADWLQEQGDPRGELIVIQCALARYATADDTVGDVRRMQQRERALLAAHFDEWTRSARAAYQGQYTFHRGFPDALHVVFTREAVLASAALTHEPLLGALVTRYADAADVRALADSPWLGRLRRYGFVKGAPNDDDLAAVVTMPHPLVELRLHFDGRLGLNDRPALIRRLTDCPARATLRTLSIRQLRHLGGLGAALGALGGLVALELENADLSHKDVVRIVRERPGLVSLDLSENYGAHQAKALDAAALLDAAPALARLRLSKLGLGDAQAIAIARSPRATSLTRLDLSRNQIGDAGGLAIAHSEHLRRIKKLNLNANKLSTATKDAVRERFPAAELQLR